MTTLPSLDPLDRRLNVCDDLICSADLKERVSHHNYVEGTPATISAPFADMVHEPEVESGLETQLLYGQTVKIFKKQASHALVQADHNCYVGWVDQNALSEGTTRHSHHVAVPRTFVYSHADLKSPNSFALSLGSKILVADFQTVRGTEYAIMPSGETLIANHLKTVGDFSKDYVDVAETLMHTPYLWGGNTSFGIDCSGLVELSMAVAGKQVLRDSDMQAATIGCEIYPDQTDNPLQRGDLVFWKGHVGIMQDSKRLIHANGHTMMVSTEPLNSAIDRIAYLYGKPIGYRRP